MKSKCILIICWLLPLAASAESARQRDVDDSAIPPFDQLAGYISLLLVLILFIIVLTRPKARVGLSDERYRQLCDKLTNELSFTFSNRIGRTQQNNIGTEDNEQIAELKKRIMQLELALKVKGRPDIPFEVITPTPEPENKVEQTAVSRETEAEDVFYLSTPNSDSSFNTSSMQPAYKVSASIYHFSRTAANEARFKIDNRETSVRMALLYPDKSIDPVCDSLNGFNPQAKKIITKKGDEGEAELSGDKWIVTRKAKITYE